MKRYIRANALQDAKSLVDRIFSGIDKLFKTFSDYGYKVKEQSKQPDGSKIYIIDTGSHKCKLKLSPIGDEKDIVDVEMRATEPEFSKRYKKRAAEVDDLKKYVGTGIREIYGDAEDGDTIDDIVESESGESYFKEIWN